MGGGRKCIELCKIAACISDEFCGRHIVQYPSGYFCVLIIEDSASNDRDQNNAKADAALELDRFCCRLKLYADSVLRTQYRFSELLEDLTGSAFLLGCPPHLQRSSSSEEEEEGGGLGSRLRQTGSVELFQTTQTKGTFGILKDDVTADVSSNPGGCEAGLDVDVVNRMQQEDRYFAEIPTEFKHPTQKA